MLRVKFMQINHLNSQQCDYGKYGFTDPKVNNDWHTFRSGAIHMLEVQRDMVEK